MMVHFFVQFRIKKSRVQCVVIVIFWCVYFMFMCVNFGLNRMNQSKVRPQQKWILVAHINLHPYINRVWHLKCNFFVFINISATRLARKVYLVFPESPEKDEASRTYLLFLASPKLDLRSNQIFKFFNYTRYNGYIQYNCKIWRFDLTLNRV